MASIEYEIEALFLNSNGQPITLSPEQVNIAGEMIFSDELTGVWNRRFFSHKLSGLTKQSEPNYGIILVDLDQLKKINDLFGHQSGDRAVCLVAKTLRSKVRAEDFVCRIGGDEFAILLPNAGLTETQNIAQNLIDAQEKSLQLSVRAMPTQNSEIPIHFSVGYAHSSQANSNEVFAYADQILYRNKMQNHQVL